MKHKPLFIFGTPEGGATDVISVLQDQGYVLGGEPEIACGNLDLAMTVASQTVSQTLGGITEELVKRLYFPAQNLPEKMMIVDTFAGVRFGAGFKLFSFLTNSIPDSRIIFARMDLVPNLSRLLAMNRKWIPSYGSCAAKCEAAMKTQVQQFEEFASIYPQRAILFDAKHGDWAALLKFVE